MSRDAPIKAEKDYTELLDEQFPQIDVLAKNDYKNALEKLLLLEKQTRQASDLASSKRVLVRIADLLGENKDWKSLNEQLVLLSKKHGQLKLAVQAFIQQAIEYLDKTGNQDTKIEIIDTIRTVTENKIFVEVERARVTRELSHIRRKEGKIDQATDLLVELQVETYGSMNLREKMEFILEQVELCILKGDFTQANILSRKILVKTLQSPDYQDIKLQYYQLLIKIGLNSNDYLNIAKHYLSIYEIEDIKKDDSKWKPILINIVYFLVLSPYDNLQNDLIHKLELDTNLKKLELHNQLVKSFITQELMRWPIIKQVYSKELEKSEYFDSKTKENSKHWNDLRDRVIEHNLRVISTYYTRITLLRLNQLLDLEEHETEHFISTLVNQGTIFAKINRPAKVVSFAKPKDSNELLNQWSSNVDELLGHIETIGHLITKEEMMNGIKASN
ncbi:26S proteasome regulatory subunit [Wickerhamomyces ciferrii]|uniref:26S proteasome regulatory subunit n=1 Tax=Wickerhamomyces ciferrii (strain ATCC 14091 / BCRC 22168 / CBS 111 / JCM 3599 / NBRC 0793 / NRRL Y-1031 F-60-10) TaxID=1206466 RepID=K0KH83_WICCF|nr:26S proteasome regulatory subunit [Wickerhamomyces ciferrii]CCH44575.1 26S proteasome regulatory subunit [Wickerhamomyces ciferrii]